MISLRSFAALGASVLTLAACERQSVQVYLAPKEVPAKPPVAAAPPASRASAPKPRLGYVLPDGWQKTDGGQMSLAAFRAVSDVGEVSVNVTPLPNLAGKEVEVINMWRQQVGQEPLSPEDAAKAVTPVDIGGSPGQLFEISGTRDGLVTRIVSAVAHTSDASWFYKLSGPEAAVAAQREPFLAFLKSVRFEQPGTATAASGPAEGEVEFKASTPEGWQVLPPGQMQVAKYTVASTEEPKAEVAVSVFPNNTGGTLANVNRWRKQLGLTETNDEGLKDHISPLGSALPEALLVEIRNEPRMILGAIVPRGGQWWFYKMTGGVPAVNAARDAFVSFAQQPSS